MLVIHSHDAEFKPINGYVPYDVTIQNTDPRTVRFPLDVRWATAGGANPATYLSRFPDRLSQLLLVDYNGQGAVAREPLAVERQCYDYFRKLT